MLSRTLERLRQGSLIVKTSKGYSVSHKPGLTYIESLNEGEKNAECIPLAQLLLPSDIDTQHVIDALKRKWFSNLRWLGYSVMDERAILKWLTEDNQIQIEATFSDSSVQIQAISRSAELNRSIIAANHLLTFIIRAHEKRPPLRV